MTTWQNRSVVVTGVSGFIGGCLLQRLTADGAAVTALCRSAPNAARFANLSTNFNVRIATTTEEIAAAIAADRPDVIFHMASHAISQHGPSDIDRLADSNLRLPMQICDAMAHSTCRAIVTLGSAWQHAHGPEYSPICLYAATKQAMRDIFKYYHVSHNIAAVMLKLFHAYGPGEVRPRLVSSLCDAVLTGQTLKMSGGNQVVDLTYIDDVLDALMQAAGQLIEGNSTDADYSIASREPITVRQLASRIEQIAGKPLHIEWGALPYKQFEFFSAVDLGPRLSEWTPHVTLDDGLRRTLLSRHQTCNL